MKESVDAVRALWVSLDLFLVQLDLQIIKEIMDNFTDSKLSLKHFIKARARTCSVKDACQVLSTAAAKRAKTEKAQDSETFSQRQLTPTKIGDINTTEDFIQVPAYAVSSADSESKNSDLSAATETTAMDTDETLTVTEGITSVSPSDAYTRSRVDPPHGYVPSSKYPAPFMGVNINDRDLYGAHAEENQLETKRGRFVAPHGTSDRTRHLSKFDTKRMVDTSELTSQSLPYLGTTTSPLPSTRISTDTHIAYTDTSARTGRQVQGSKYVGLRDIRGSASHQVASNASFQSYRPKETASQHKNSTDVEDRRQLSATEPMEVETQESRANRLENFGSYSNKMAEGGYARPEAQPGVSEYSHRSSRLNEFTGGAYALSKAHAGFSDLDRKRLHHLTLENGTSKGAAVQSSSAKEATSKAPSGVSDSSRAHNLSSRSNEFTGGAYAGAEGQPGVSEYSHRSSRSNEFTGGAYAGAEGQPGVSEYRHRSSRSNEFTGGAYAGAEGQPGVSEYSHRSSRSNEFTGGAYAGAEGQPGVSEYRHRSSRSNEFTGGAYAGAEAQPGVSEYSHRSSRLNEFTGGAYALSKARTGFSDLDGKRLHHLTLENGTSKRAAVQSSSAKEATSHGTGTTRVEYVPDDAVVSQSNCSPLPNVGTGYSYSLYKKEGNGLSDHVRYNTRSAARSLQDQGKSDEKFRESRLKRDYYSERSGKDPVPGAEATSLRKDEELNGATSKLDPKHAASLCGHCVQQGELMCRNCLLIVCKECDREIYSTELCGSTKGRHVFSELKSANSLDTSCSNPVYEGKEWSCSRCTFLNQLEHKICVMCGATRGVGDVEQSKPGSIVCRFCTFHNERDATVCKACGKTLDKSETFV